MPLLSFGGGLKAHRADALHLRIPVLQGTKDTCSMGTE